MEKLIDDLMMVACDMRAKGPNVISRYTLQMSHTFKLQLDQHMSKKISQVKPDFSMKEFCGCQVKESLILPPGWAAFVLDDEAAVRWFNLGDYQ